MAGSGKLLSVLFSVLGFETETSRRRGGNVGIAAAISKGGGKGGKPAFGFPRFPAPGISTALSWLTSAAPIRRCASRVPVVSFWPVASRWLLRCRIVVVRTVAAGQG